MARYKAKSTTGKLVASKTEVSKSETVEGRWVIDWLPQVGKVLPGISTVVDTSDPERPKVTELPDFKLRRDAANARDALLEAVDALDPATTAAIPLEDSIRLALEALATTALAITALVATDG